MTQKKRDILFENSPLDHWMTQKNGTYVRKIDHWMVGWMNSKLVLLAICYYWNCPTTCKTTIRKITSKPSPKNFVIYTAKLGPKTNIKWPQKAQTKPDSVPMVMIITPCGCCAKISIDLGAESAIDDFILRSESP